MVGAARASAAAAAAGYWNRLQRHCLSGCNVWIMSGLASLIGLSAPYINVGVSLHGKLFQNIVYFTRPGSMASAVEVIGITVGMGRCGSWGSGQKPGLNTVTQEARQGIRVCNYPRG